MPLQFPSSPTTGATYTDQNSVTWVYDGVKWFVTNGSTKKMFSGVKISLASPFACSNTSTAISFDSEAYDTDSYYNAITPERLEVPANAFYRINATIFTASQGTSYVVEVKANNTTLSSVILNGSQASRYDEIVELNRGDLIRVYVSEATATGSIAADSFIEVSTIGLSIGTGVTPFQAFSGVRVTSSTSIATTTTPTAISWDSSAFNSNADVLGNNYWSSSSNPSRITIKTSAYYRVRSLIKAGSSGTYTVTIKKNNVTTLASATLNANEVAQTDEVYNFQANDYIQIIANNATSTGSLTTDTYLEVVRIGV